MNSKKRKIVVGFVTTFILSIFFGLITIFIVFGSDKNQWLGISSGYQKIMVMPNSPIEKDGGFNQLTIAGSGNYSIESSEAYGFSNKVGKITPKEIDNINEYNTIIDNAYSNGADIMVASGFNVIDSLIGRANWDDYYRVNEGMMFKPSNKENWFILVDDATYDLSVSRNSISFKFNGGEAGFIAGIAASIYAISNGSYTVSTFGGMSLSTVYDWMSGYEQGINWFNYAVLGFDLNGEKIGNSILEGTGYDKKPVKLINGLDINDGIDYSSKSKFQNEWFSGSFNLGDGKEISARQIDHGSTVLFPVAGGQTGDALNVALINKNKNVKVIGVDSDANISYPDFKDFVLGSATKNIEKAVRIGLWYIQRFILEYDENIDAFQNEEFDNKYYDLISTPLEEGGWKEDEAEYTNRDLTLLSNEEANNYKGNGEMLIKDFNDYGNFGKQLKYGSMFSGTYKNGGIGFLANQILYETYSDIFYSTSYPTFDSLITKGFEDNPVIEISSHTFYNGDFQLTSPGLYDWIPDWDKY